MIDWTELSESEYFMLVHKRLSMYLGRPTLGKAEAFLYGYDQHARRHGGSSLEGWTDWLIARLGRHCNLTWGGIVANIAAEGGSDAGQVETRVIDLMFELLVEYLREVEAAS